MNKQQLVFRVFLLATGVAALVIRLSTLVVDTALSIDFTGFQVFALVSFALYAAFAVITLVLSFLSLKKTSGSAVPGQVLYIACLFVLLGVVLNLPAFFKAAALDFSSASPAFVAVNSPFLFNYGKGFGSIAIGDFTNYFLGLAVTVSMVMGIIALVLLVRSVREGRGTAVPFTRYSRQDRTKDYRRPRATAKRVSSARQVDIFERSNDFFSHHTEDDIF
ncbi:hypothetical protein DW091_08220 [Eubacterium sp. AM05-23]|uniref:hypothetical protein n=1 Tax=Eubacterium TaxID=1730 RepID=UPI000E4F9EC0|nr:MULTISPECIES: hypothetical protein [Eubacterium]RHO58832.1 hypothetical protein DW091_08220 [Eubacterium sp. AM05-23]